MASASNWLIIIGLVLLVGIAALYFTTGGDGAPSAGADQPAPDAPADGATAGN